MDFFLRPFAATKIVAGCIFGLLASPLFADELSLFETFELADMPTLQATYSVSYQIDDCVLKRTIVNFGYCQRVGQGDDDRTVITRIDLREVEAISTSEFRGSFHMNFDLDFGGPGSSFVWTDRLLNGAEGGLERYMERSRAALLEAELNSGVWYSRCEDASLSLVNDTPSSSISLVIDTEPEGWQRLIDLAKECRAPKSMDFVGR